MPATGKHAEWTESHIVKLVNGKITEHWGVIDQLGMLRQLGLADRAVVGGVEDFVAMADEFSRRSGAQLGVGIDRAQFTAAACGEAKLSGGKDLRLQ